MFVLEENPASRHNNNNKVTKTNKKKVLLKLETMLKQPHSEAELEGFVAIV